MDTVLAHATGPSTPSEATGVWQPHTVPYHHSPSLHLRVREMESRTLTEYSVSRDHTQSVNHAQYIMLLPQSYPFPSPLPTTIPTVSACVIHEPFLGPCCNLVPDAVLWQPGFSTRS